MCIVDSDMHCYYEPTTDIFDTRSLIQRHQPLNNNSDKNGSSHQDHRQRSPLSGVLMNVVESLRLLDNYKEHYPAIQKVQASLVSLISPMEDVMKKSAELAGSAAYNSETRTTDILAGTQETTEAVVKSLIDNDKVADSLSVFVSSMEILCSNNAALLDTAVDIFITARNEEARLSKSFSDTMQKLELRRSHVLLSTKQALEVLRRTGLLFKIQVLSNITAELCDGLRGLLAFVLSRNRIIGSPLGYTAHAMEGTSGLLGNLKSFIMEKAEDMRAELVGDNKLLENQGAVTKEKVDDADAVSDVSSDGEDELITENWCHDAVEELKALLKTLVDVSAFLNELKDSAGTLKSNDLVFMIREKSKERKVVGAEMSAMKGPLDLYYLRWAVLEGVFQKSAEEFKKVDILTKNLNS